MLLRPAAAPNWNAEAYVLAVTTTATFSILRFTGDNLHGSPGAEVRSGEINACVTPEAPPN